MSTRSRFLVATRLAPIPGPRLLLAALRRIAVTLAICWAMAALASAGTWRQIGPDGADTWSVAFDPSTPGVVYAGTCDGVYRSNDGGTSWTRIGLAGWTVAKLAVHRRTPAVVYAAAYRGDDSSRTIVLRSWDGGVSWAARTSIYSTQRVWSIALDPTDPDRVWLATDNGLRWSTNGGSHWEVGSGHLGWMAFQVVVDPSTPATVYVVGTDGLYKSTDGGQTWAPSPNGQSGGSANAGDLVIDPSQTQTIYALGVNGPLKSTDGGSTWSLAANGFPPYALTFSNLNLAPADPATLLVNTNQGLYTSHDGGQSWQSLACAGGPCTSLPRPIHQLAYDPNDASTLFAMVDHLGVYTSHDGGSTWGESSRGMHATYVTALLVDPDGAIWAGTQQQGAFRSEDGGQTWRQTMGDGPVNGCFEEGPCFEVDRLVALSSPPRIVACTTWGALVSADGGGSWRSLGGRGSALDVAQDPAQPGTLALAATNMGLESGGLFLSADGGATWTEPSRTMGTLAASAVTFPPWAPSTALAASWMTSGEDGAARLLESTNHGATWATLADDPFGITALLPDPATPGLILAAAWRGVARSTDGGATWTPANEGIPPCYSTPCAITALVRDPAAPATLVAATRSALFTSHDGAASWTPLGSAPGNTDVRALALVDGGRTLLAGTYGSGVWALDLAEKRAIRRSLSRVP